VAKYSKYQQNIIRKYYENRDSIALQRVQELVTELYLSSGKKRAKYWEQLASHLAKLGIPSSRIEYLVAQDNPELVAKTVQQLIEKS
jgi:acetylornithine deacetylase/succinyl-diaminopimelate desuccinylase-like protein